MSKIEVEICQYRTVKKEGIFKATFSVVIHPHGQKILDCRYFVKGDNRWFSFPQKEIVSKDGEEKSYIPYVSYLDKEYLEILKEEILSQLKEISMEPSYAKTQNPASRGTKSALQNQSSSLFEELPF
jgi:hypothetical protein